MYNSVVCSTFNVKCSWDGLLEGRNCFCVWLLWCSELCSVDQTATVQRRSVLDVRGPEWFCQPLFSLWDDALCSFYDASLNTSSRALSSEYGPREDFANFVEWTLARNGSPFPVSSEEDLASSTLDPVPSPQSPRRQRACPRPPKTKNQSPPRAIAARSDKATDCYGPGAACDISPGKWPGKHARHEGECRGQWESWIKSKTYESWIELIRCLTKNSQP